ncbi:MAG TPA: type II secretion system protein M [Pseudomonadales bacterium]|jgi:type II secretory pathway component PulM|nr:type II secretion system protein M [Pseudomonadales bacterium]MDP7313707.1 type II secretion system protein M [Pseudomonadales bacterium]HJL61585.1 type II secretion system protein M [Pseudomonadales bacterium]
MSISSYPLIQSGLTRYGQLEKRDRLALNGLLVFFSLLALYGLIWSPANSFLEESRQNHDRQLELLQYLRGSEQQARSVRTSQPAADGGSLLSRVSGTAQRFKVKPDRLQPEGSDGVSVFFSSASFNDLIGWLEGLSKEGFTVRQINIAREEESGKVNARLVLRL